jgi:YD repeat-containing protein
MTDHTERDEQIRAAVKARLTLGQDPRRAVREVATRYGLTMGQVQAIVNPDGARRRADRDEQHRIQRALAKKRAQSIPDSFWERHTA